MSESRLDANHFTFHDLRRTHGTMLVAAGTDPKVIKQRMGHESIETTLKYYAELTKHQREEAAQVAIRYLTLANADSQSLLVQNTEINN